MSQSTNTLHESFCHWQEFALFQNIINKFKYKLPSNESQFLQVSGVSAIIFQLKQTFRPLYTTA